MTRFFTPFLALAAVLLAVSAVTFAIQDALPGDAAEVYVGKRDDLNDEQRNELVEQVRKNLGLDKRSSSASRSRRCLRSRRYAAAGAGSRPPPTASRRSAS
jgi:ABC-type dipeptide/oligopeptide/nickel transport system permease component